MIKRMLLRWLAPEKLYQLPKRGGTSHLIKTRQTVFHPSRVSADRFVLNIEDKYCPITGIHVVNKSNGERYLLIQMEDGAYLQFDYAKAKES